jgi:hypothetical protein
MLGIHPQGAVCAIPQACRWQVDVLVQAESHCHKDLPVPLGDGNPSGGPFAANGVMMYHSTSSNGSYLETCTLPDDYKAICTSTLNNFVEAYGAD